MRIIEDNTVIEEVVYDYDKEVVHSCSSCKSVFAYKFNDIGPGQRRIQNEGYVYTGVSYYGIHSGRSEKVEEVWEDCDVISCPVCGKIIQVSKDSFRVPTPQPQDKFNIWFTLFLIGICLIWVIVPLLMSL